MPDRMPGLPKCSSSYHTGQWTPCSQPEPMFYGSCTSNVNVWAKILVKRLNSMIVVKVGTKWRDVDLVDGFLSIISMCTKAVHSVSSSQEGREERACKWKNHYLSSGGCFRPAKKTEKSTHERKQDTDRVTCWILFFSQTFSLVVIDYSISSWNSRCNHDVK